METELAAIDHVISIHDQGTRLSIRVRVIAVWRVPFSHMVLRPYCLDMILMDRMGTKIRASVCRMHPITHSIQAGRVYKFSNFKAILNDGIRFTPHQFRLLFNTRTHIVESYDVRIPRFGWSFYNTQVLRARAHDVTHLIDLIGVVSAASEEKFFVNDGQLTKMLIIDLQDSRGKIRCIVIGSIMNPLAEYLASSWTVRPIVVLQFVKLKRFRDKFLIQGMPIASRVHINPDIDQVVELTHRMSILGINYHGPVAFIGGNDTNVNMKDDMLYTFPRKTLTQLMENKEGGIFIVHAGIVGVLRDGNWSYPSCRCLSELRINGTKYDCLKCGRSVGQFINRFRFKVEVFDGVDSAVFVLFDHEVEQLIGFSCEELINNIEVENKDIPEGDYPDNIEDNLAGREMLFKVRNNVGMTHGKDDCFEVMRICTDLDIIAMFHDRDVFSTPKKASLFQPFQKWRALLLRMNMDPASLPKLQAYLNLPALNKVFYAFEGSLCWILSQMQRLSRMLMDLLLKLPCQMLLNLNLLLLM